MEIDSIIERIQVTEKSTALADQNKYLFRVHPLANKMQVKQAVEKMFNVSVAAVNTMNYEGKKKKNRAHRSGKRADWKRAVVTLKDGHKIDLTK
mgnify:CR=1 FL=1